MTKQELEEKIQKLESENTELRKNVENTSRLHAECVEEIHMLRSQMKAVVANNVNLGQILASKL